MKIVNKKTVSDLLLRAAASPRKRMNHNLHTELADPINRFVNAGVADTYVRPHRHRIGKWELVSVLQGGLDLVLFTESGTVKSRLAISSENIAVAEIPGGAWHSFVFQKPSAVILEVKPGPYEPQDDKEFAEWAPLEGDPNVTSFVRWLEKAERGERWLKP
jgi:cupin fold WbuC family metalloprotein